MVTKNNEMTDSIRIDIQVPDSVLAENEARRERLAATRSFGRPNRPAVLAAPTPRYVFAQRGLDFGEYFHDPRVQFEQQLMNHKWMAANLRDDRVIDTSEVVVAPDLQSVRGGFFPITVNWRGEGLPVAEPLLHDPGDIDKLKLPEPRENLFGRNLDWFEQMAEMAAGAEVTLNGLPLPVRVAVGVAGGPWPHAYALAGTNLFLWLYEAPEAVHRLMELITTVLIRYEQACRRLTGRADGGITLGCDSAEMLSPEMFREFVVPYYRRCYDAFPGQRGFHMCGRIDHLLEIIASELAITSLDGFGSVTDPVKLAETMGGKVVLAGGIDINLLRLGPVEAIERECQRYLETFAPHGGYILQDGYNVAPDTSLEHVHAMVRAAERFAG